jgi:hypothetical protein
MWLQAQVVPARSGRARARCPAVRPSPVTTLACGRGPGTVGLRVPTAPCPARPSHELRPPIIGAGPQQRGLPIPPRFIGHPVIRPRVTARQPRARSAASIQHPPSAAASVAAPLSTHLVVASAAGAGPSVVAAFAAAGIAVAASTVEGLVAVVSTEADTAERAAPPARAAPESPLARPCFITACPRRACLPGTILNGI